MRHKFLYSILIAVVLTAASACPVSAQTLTKNDATPHVEHFDKIDISQRNQTLWVSLLPKETKDVVYEFDNEDRIVYTMNEQEKADLQKTGWENMGPVFYSDDTGNGLPVYRLHNDTLHFIYSLDNTVDGYTLDGIAFFVERPVVMPVKTALTVSGIMQ